MFLNYKENYSSCFNFKVTRSLVGYSFNYLNCLYDYLKLRSRTYLNCMEFVFDNLIIDTAKAFTMCYKFIHFNKYHMSSLNHYCIFNNKVEKPSLFIPNFNIIYLQKRHSLYYLFFLMVIPSLNFLHSSWLYNFNIINFNLIFRTFNIIDLIGKDHFMYFF